MAADKSTKEARETAEKIGRECVETVYRGWEYDIDKAALLIDEHTRALRDEIWSLKRKNDLLCKTIKDQRERHEKELDAAREALRDILADHKERVSLYGENELQPNRERVMNEAEAILAGEKSAAKSEDEKPAAIFERWGPLLKRLAEGPPPPPVLMEPKAKISDHAFVEGLVGVSRGSCKCGATREEHER